MMGSTTFALQLLAILPSLINAGLQVQGIITATNAKLTKMVEEKRDPTEAEWDELNAAIDELRTQLHLGEVTPKTA